ncbi:hypothetical protein M3484_10725 [Pseudomonas sp. GX19020]|nr:hypothetical protein [Pseudomonas sp. GX19020]MCL4067044.1 hypothetical protein [Pseudomonas sp. GX19020]
MRQTSSLTILRKTFAAPVILILLLATFAILSWAVGSRPSTRQSSTCWCR